MTEVRDYNGAGDWSAEGLLRRYRECAAALQQEARDLTPREHNAGDVRWVYPVMDAVIAGIKANDRACIELGVQYIERGPQQAFGRSLHSNTARALRRAELSSEQEGRLRIRILGMLVTAEVPREYEDYAKLLRRIGLGEAWTETRARVDETNPHVMRHVRYLESIDGSKGRPTTR